MNEYFTILYFFLSLYLYFYCKTCRNIQRDMNIFQQRAIIKIRTENKYSAFVYVKLWYYLYMQK